MTSPTHRLVARISCLLALCLAIAGRAGGMQGESTVAFVGVNVIPMDSERVLTRHTVIIQGDRIVAIDPEDEVSVPRGARRIEAAGSYLIPGLVDVHAELLSGRHIDADFVEDELALMVANGIVASRVVSAPERLLEVRDRIADEDVLGPLLYVAAPMLSSGGSGGATAGTGSGSGLGTRVVGTPFEAAAAVRELTEAGYDFVALSADLGEDIYQGIVLTARGSRIRIFGQVPPPVGLQRALEAGQQISHLDGYLEALMDTDAATGGLSGGGVWHADNWAALDHVDDGRIEDVVRSTLDAEGWNAPALAYFAAELGDPADADAQQGPAGHFVSPAVMNDILMPRGGFWANPPDAEKRRRFFELRDRLVRELYEGGGNLLVASGGTAMTTIAGLGVHAELEAMVNAGLPPFAALSTATDNPARFLTGGGGGGRTEYATVDEGAIRFESTAIPVDFGTVTLGMRANLLLLRSNPLDDIANTRDIEGVVLRGRWLSRDELDDLIERAADRLSDAAPNGEF